MDFIPNFKQDDLLFTTFQYYIVVVLEAVYLFMLKYFNNPMPIIWFVFAALPTLDYLIPHDIRNPTKEEAKRLQNDLRFKIPLYMSLVISWISQIWVINWLVNTESQLSYFIIAATIYASGTLGAVGMNVSHEMIHKDDKFERLLGIINLGRWFYQHWYIEHLWGHHKNVGTTNDAATSKVNQSLYNFYPQTLWGAIESAWHLEKQRCEIKYGSVWTINNKLIYFMLNNLALPYVCYLVWGFKGAMYFCLIAIVAILYIEMINYIEHYGLYREETQLVTIDHSWNTPHRISNYVLFKLQRHSDHHENAFKPYQTLCSYDESPNMPQGYPLMILLAVFPSKWFKVMNPLLKLAQKQKVSKAEVEQAHAECREFARNTFIGVSTLLALSFFM